MEGQRTEVSRTSLALPRGLVSGQLRNSVERAKVDVELGVAKIL